MRILAKGTLRDFWEDHPDARQPLEDWYNEAKRADWNTSSEVKAQFRDASILKGSRVVFNIKGNDYRLVVKINYSYGVVYVRFIGKHAGYDGIDAETV